MEPKPRLLSIFDGIALLFLIIATVLVFFYAPIEAVMGPVQKVFYFHVSSGWVGMLGFLAAVLSGIAFLRTGNRKWDTVGLASIEVGLVFVLMTVISGSIWARPIWNTWWTWDPRLTTASIMLLIYAAYLMLRSGIDDPERRARFSAIYAIVGFLSVPLTFFSARAFRTIHPIVIGLNEAGAAGSFDMTPRMQLAFFFSLFTFTIIFVDLLWHRIRLGRLQEKVEQLKYQLNA